jgi:tetratricopeptide (TPR) repeat protein
MKRWATRLASYAQIKLTWFGRFWAAHWAAIMAGFFILLSAVIKWIDFPFSRDLTGIQFPVLQNAGLLPHTHLLSYGLVTIVVLGLGLLSFQLSRTLPVWAASLLITLCLLAPLQIAFQQPALLRRLTTEVRAVSSIREFTKQNLPQNYGNVADIPSHLSLDTAWSRLMAACSFLAPGWYSFALAALLMAGYSVARGPGGPSNIPRLIVLPLVVTALLLARPLIGEHYLLEAMRAKAETRYSEAIASYRKALFWDPWYRKDLDVYLSIGDLQTQLAYSDDSPEQHIFRAQQFLEVSNYDSAIFEFDRAAAAGGAVGLAARRGLAQTRIDYGLALYRMSAVGAAVTNWRRALADDPSLGYALLYLARGDFDLSRYQTSLDSLRSLIKICSHDTVLANSYAMAGDCYAKLGLDGEARRYYNLSLNIDIIDNHWAMSALVGH